MQWSSAVSEAAGLEGAVAEAAAAVRAGLGGAPDLAFVFVSPHHTGSWSRLPALVRGALGAPRLVGCTAGGVIGGGREVEQRPGLALVAAALPGVDVQPFHVAGRAIPALPADAACVLLPDPFTCDADALLHALEAAPPRTVVGGLASGGRTPGANALFVDDTVHRGGCAGVSLRGALVVDTVVAQGCRPIGEPMFVTRAERNLLRELDGRPAVEVLRALYAGSSDADRALFRGALFVGIGMDPDRQRFGHGDFVVRNVVGVDPDRGALAVGAPLAEGLVVQFHLRDAATSRDELEGLLARYVARAGGARPAGALLFSCLGRGVGLYGEPDHDTAALRRHLGDVPVGGFFCNGEIGPVEGRTFLHGYTSAFALFRPASPDE
jgi:small ligand-binding sensory domain FIST